MKYQILFSGEKKEKNIVNLLPAELTKRMVKVKKMTDPSNSLAH